MAANIHRDRTVEALEEVWASIADLVATLTDEQWHLPSPLPGWDVQDNVAHIAGTEAMLLGHETPAVEIDRDIVSHVRSDAGAYNERWVASMRGLAPAEMIARFEELTAERLGVLRAMPQHEWDADSLTPAGRSTYGRFMQIRVFDCWLHEQDIRDAVSVPGHAEGLAVEVTLDEMTTAMGFVVGKRAGIGSGQSVTFALTGGGAVVRQIDIEVAERASVVESLDAPATSILTMPVGVMTRLAAGRVQLDDVREQVDVAGDEVVAAVVLDNLNYTI
jgi:uncharacterized protein (TIGR03083 family)